MILSAAELAQARERCPIAYEETGSPADRSAWRLIWAHGWGHDREVFLPLAAALSAQASHLLIDFPGFGASPPPPAPWGTADYADALAAFIAARPSGGKTMWVGHSFGCRVGLQIAARHPDLIDGLFLIAAAGLPRKRSLLEKIHLKGRVYTFKLLRRAAPLLGLDVGRLRQRFGSADYVRAGAMRPVLAKVVAEDLSEVARQVRCPVRLIYGAHDTETPPEIGERLAKLISHAELTILPRLDHYSVLTLGKHQVLKRLRDFLEVCR